MKIEETEKLQKYLARCGVASRRECETIIAQGRVKINGNTVSAAGIRINPHKDAVVLDGKKINPPAHTGLFLLLNKPTGCISARVDPENRTIIYDYIPRKYHTLSHVGRLDYHTEGLIIFTNNGDLAQKLTKPRSGITKVYEVKVKGQPTIHAIHRLRKGIILDGRKTLPLNVELMRQTRKNSWYRVEMREGKNRQIRRMFEVIRYPVLKLRRVAFGPLRLKGIPPGKWRLLTPEEIKRLHSVASH